MAQCPGANLIQYTQYSPLLVVSCHLCLIRYAVVMMIFLKHSNHKGALVAYIFEAKLHWIILQESICSCICCLKGSGLKHCKNKPNNWGEFKRIFMIKIRREAFYRTLTETLCIYRNLFLMTTLCSCVSFNKKKCFVPFQWCIHQILILVFILCFNFIVYSFICFSLFDFEIWRVY